MAQVYQDIDIFGEENYNGTPKEYLDKDALKTALTMWLMSKRGDYLEAPYEGGIIDFTLFKNLTGELEEIIKFRIETSFKLYFNEVVELLSIDILPNYTQRYLEIAIGYKDLLSGTIEDITIYPKTLTKQKSFVYKEIDLTGINLFNYVKAAKPDMLGMKLVYNLDELCWIWGNRIKFIDFNFEDEYFEAILEYINAF